VAALDGSALECEILLRQFAKKEAATSERDLAVSKFGLVFKLAYTYGCRSWITSFMMLPVLRAKASTAVGTMGSEIAQIQFSWQLMIEMLVANGNLLTLHATAQHMFGNCKRVCELIDTLQNLEAKQKQAKATSFCEGECIEFKNVQVFTPTGQHLVKDLSFSLERGGSLLLTGHNGAGKSSIFRCLGGLWSVTQGTITKPGAATSGLHQDIYYLPQKPYNVLGSLRDQVTYPQAKADVQLSDAELCELLAAVNLLHLKNASSSDELMNWEV
jgi:ABC-type uncharacterized transport system fused permease/ATPase subunit